MTSQVAGLRSDLPIIPIKPWSKMVSVNLSIRVGGGTGRDRPLHRPRRRQDRHNTTRDFVNPSAALRLWQAYRPCVCAQHHDPLRFYHQAVKVSPDVKLTFGFGIVNIDFNHIHRSQRTLLANLDSEGTGKAASPWPSRVKWIWRVAATVWNHGNRLCLRHGRKI